MAVVTVSFTVSASLRLSLLICKTGPEPAGVGETERGGAHAVSAGPTREVGEQRLLL